MNARFIIDNRGGAGGTVGASAAAKAAPDGYTFFIGAAHHAIAPALYPKLDYNIETDFVPVGVIASPPQVVVANPAKVQAKTLKEFIDFAKANRASSTMPLPGMAPRIIWRANCSSSWRA